MVIPARSSLSGVAHSRMPETPDLKSIMQNDDASEFSRYLSSHPDELEEVTVDGKDLLMRLLDANAKRCAGHVIKTYRSSFDCAKVDQTGASALHYAARKNAPDIARDLIDMGASYTVCDFTGISPLHIAVSEGYPDIVGLFICSKQTCRTLFQAETQTPLHLAASGSTDILRLVLQIAPDINVVDPARKTPLHYAVQSSYALANCKLLVDNDALVDVEDIHGCTPLTDAIRKKSSELVEMLHARGADLNRGALHPLIHAYLQNSPYLFSVLTRLGSDINKASLYGKSFAEILIVLGAVDYFTLLNQKAFNFPIDITQLNSPNKLVQCLLQGKLIEFCYFLTHGKLPDSAKEQALHTATHMGNTFALLLLLRCGVNPNAQTFGSLNTCLHLIHTANVSTHTKEEIIDILVSHGASLELENKEGRTPLLEAYNERDMNTFSSFLKHGANPNAIEKNRSLLQRTCEEGNFQAAQALVQRGADRNFKKTAIIPLIAAIMRGLAPTVRLLLTERVVVQHKRVECADPNLTCSGISPLLVAINCLYAECVGRAFENPTETYKKTETQEYEIFQLLLEHGAKVSTKTGKISIKEKMITCENSTTTPLLQATEYNLVEVVRALLNSGAEPKKVDGKDPVAIACEKHYLEILSEFLSRGAKISKDVSDRVHSYSSAVQQILLEHVGQADKKRTTGKLSSRLQTLRIGSRSSEPTHISSSSASESLNQVSISSRVAAFQREDHCTEQLLRERFVSGNYLLFKESRLFPLSMCRIGNSMNISIDGQLIIRKEDKYEDAITRDAKAEIIVGKLLTAIQKTLGETQSPRAFRSKVQLMSHMDCISDEIRSLDIYKDNKLNAQNRDLIALRLIAKEAALMAILPVQKLFQNYCQLKSKEIEMQSLMRDQWDSINIVRTSQGFEGHGTTTISFEATIETKTVKAAKLDIHAVVAAVEATGEVTLTITRKNLVFMENIPVLVKRHILSALDNPILSGVS